MTLCVCQSALDSSPRNPSPVVQNGDKGEQLLSSLQQLLSAKLLMFADLCVCVCVFAPSEDRHLSMLPSSSSSILPSPGGEPGAELVPPTPSCTEQDSLSIPEGLCRSHSLTHTHTHRTCRI